MKYYEILINDCVKIVSHVSFIGFSNYVISIIIKWSGISPYFARLWIAETAFTGVYLRMSTPQTTICKFGVSIFSYASQTSVVRDKNAEIVSLATIFVKEIPDDFVKQ